MSFKIHYRNNSIDKNILTWFHVRHLGMTVIAVTVISFTPVILLTNDVAVVVVGFPESFDGRLSDTYYHVAPSQSRSYGSLICINLYNKCLSPIKLWIVFLPVAMSLTITYDWSHHETLQSSLCVIWKKIRRTNE